MMNVANKKNDLNIGVDVEKVIKKISIGGGVYPLNTFISSLMEIGADASSKINIVEIPTRERFIKVKINNGRQRKIKIFSNEEYEIVTKKKLMPPESWYENINNQITLKNRLQENVNKAKKELSNEVL